MKKELGLFVLLVVLCLTVIGINIGQQMHDGTAFSQLAMPDFLTKANLTNVSNLIGMFGIFSIGMGLVIITGGIDLSVGSMCALVGVLLYFGLIKWHWPWPLAALGAVLVPMLLGAVHGFLITKMRIQPFIITLCGLLIYRGLARYAVEDATVGFGSAEGFKSLKYLATGTPLGVPMPFVLLIIISVIMWFVLHRSIYGRYLLAVGRNEEAVRFSGISTRMIIASSYVVAGGLTGISAILFAFYTNNVSPSGHGNFYELYGIAAAVLGGCSLRGGEGSIVGILIGTALLIVLRNMVNLLGIDSSLDFTVMGSVVLVGVLADQILKTRAAKKLVKH
jgi:ribose transport system permease protein